MNNKDDDSEIISKRVLDWLTRVGAIATALFAVFGVFLPQEDAKRVAFAVAFLLAVGSAVVYYYQRRRMARYKIAENAEPLASSAALRGLLPFEEGDNLPGRAGDVRGLYTLVAGSTFRFGVLWGESGCGKTSLLRAGLVPALRKDKYLPLYIGKPTKEPREAIRTALKRANEELGARVDEDLKLLLREATPKGKKIVILFDQFEEFFLTNRTPRSRASFIKWLGEVVAEENLPIVFLIGIRSDFFAQLQNLAPQVSDPTSPQSTYQMQNFEVEEAKQILNAAAKIDAIPFEPALIEAVVSDLETEEFIRPAELQIVGTRLKRKSVFNLNHYEILGRARGILSSYIVDEIKQSVNEQTARLILRQMCADTFDTKSPIDLGLDDFLRGMGGSGQPADMISSGRPEDIQVILNQFAAARVVIHTDDDKYNLVHDYLAPYVRTATEGMETSNERANRLLKRYVAEYKEDPKTRIPFNQLRWIQKCASSEVISGSKAQELLRGSKRKLYSSIVFGWLVPALLIIGLFIFLANSYYLSTDGPYLVIRTGRPEVKFLPGFNQVAVQTDFTLDDLTSSPTIRDEIIREQVTGLWSDSSKYGYQTWGAQLVAHLSEVPQAWALHWLGQTEFAANSLITVILDHKTDTDLYDRAMSALIQIVQSNPQLIMGDLSQPLHAIITDPETEQVVRDKAVDVVGHLGLITPQIITADMLSPLSALITRTRYASFSTSQTADVIVRLAKTNPTDIMPALLQSLRNIVVDPNVDAGIRFKVASALGEITGANPQSVTLDIVQLLHNIVADPKAEPGSRIGAAKALGQLTLAKSVIPDVLQSLVSIADNTQEFSYVRSDSISTLGQLGTDNPQAITPDIIQRLSTVVSDKQSDSSLSENAVNTLGRLAQANPQAVLTSVIENLRTRLTDPKADLEVRLRVADALGKLGQVKPQAVSTELLQALRDKFIDPMADLDSRYDALDILLRLPQANFQVVTPDMLQDVLTLLNDPEARLNARLRAVTDLGKLGSTAPQVLTPKIFQELNAIVTDAQIDSSLRSRTTDTLIQLTRVNTQTVTPELLTTLYTISVNPNIGDELRSRATDALGQLSQANPQAVTAEFLQTLPNAFADLKINSDSRLSAARVLIKLGLVNPQAVKPNMLIDLSAMTADSTADSVSRYYAAAILWQLGDVKLQTVTPDMLQSLRSTIRDPRSGPRLTVTAAQALGKFAQVNPRIVTPEVLQALINIADDSEVSSDWRDSAVIVLGELGQLNPEAIDLDTLKSLTSIVQDTKLDSSLRSDVATILGQLAPAVPQIVTSDMLLNLGLVMGDSKANESLHSSVASAVGALVPTVGLTTTQELIGYLKTREDSTGRLGVIYVLFIIVCKDPSRATLVRNGLDKLHEGFEPHLRIAASKALDMLAIGDLLQDVSDHPEEMDSINANLRWMSLSDEGYVKFAATFVLQEVSKLKPIVVNTP